MIESLDYHSNFGGWKELFDSLAECLGQLASEIGRAMVALRQSDHFDKDVLVVDSVRLFIWENYLHASLFSLSLGMRGQLRHRSNYSTESLLNQ